MDIIGTFIRILNITTFSSIIITGSFLIIYQSTYEGITLFLVAAIFIIFNRLNNLEKYIRKM